MRGGWWALGAIAALGQGFQVAGGGCKAAGSWTGEKVLDAQADFTLQWRVKGDELELAVSAKTAGWLAVGIGEETSGSMLGADIVAAHVDESECSVNVEDMYVPWKPFPFAPYTGGPENPFPVLDESSGGCSDWHAISGSLEDGCTQVVVKRKLETGDGAFDRPIVLGKPTRVIWAFGATKQVTYHGANRGSAGIDFGSANLEEDEITCSDCFAHDLTLNNAPIPSHVTSYLCQAFEMPTGAAGNHTIAFYPKIDNAKYVHHILVHACDDDDYFRSHLDTPSYCGGSKPGGSPLSTRCHSLLYAWAVGGRPVILPEEAGVLISDTSNKHIVIEVHYNNPLELSGQVDSTTIRMVMTPTLRTHNAGVLVVGDPTLGSDNLPGNKEIVHRVGECAPECTGQAIPAGEKITVFASFPHMHSFGKQMWTNVYSADNTYKTTITETDYWNFEFQSTFVRSPVVEIESGDILFTHCRYDTRRSGGDVVFGEASLDEMCMDFLYHYPVRTLPYGPGGAPEPWTVCGLALGLQKGAGALGYASLLNDFPGGYAALKQLKPWYPDTGFGSFCNLNVVPAHSEKFTIPDPTFTNPLRTRTFEVPVQRRDDRVWSDSESAYVRPVQFGDSNSPSTCPAELDTSVNATVCEDGNGGANGPSECESDPSFPFQAKPFGDRAGGMAFCWQPLQDPESGKCQLRTRLQVDGDRWVAFGLGSEMADADVIIAHALQVAEYRLTARALSGVNLASAPSGLVDPEWTLQAGKRVLLSTVTSFGGRELDPTMCSSASAARRLSEAGTNFVFAVGSSASLAQHEAATGLELQLTSGASEQGDGPTTKNSLLQAHSILMTILFTLCMPVLAILPFFKHRGERWFLLHRVLAVLSMVLLIAGLVCAFLYVDNHVSKAHHWVGLCAAILLCINPFLGLVRPSKESERRDVWFMAHRLVGYGAFVCGLIAMILGGQIIVDGMLPEYFGEQSLGATIGFAILAIFLYIGGRVNASMSAFQKGNEAKLSQAPNDDNRQAPAIC